MVGACPGRGGAAIGFPKLNSALDLYRTLWLGTMSTVVAQSHHVFGLQSHVANNVFFFDEQIIIFPAGNQCVRYNIDQKWQKFIPGKPLSINLMWQI